MILARGSDSLTTLGGGTSLLVQRRLGWAYRIPHRLLWNVSTRTCRSRRRRASTTQTSVNNTLVDLPNACRLVLLSCSNT